MPGETLMAAMAAYHQELLKAGALVDATGLQPTAKGWRIRYSAGERTVMKGPFSDAQRPIAGYTVIKVKSREEAMDWARRFPNPHGEGAEAEIEARQLFELEDFAPGEALDRFQEMENTRRK